MNQDIVAYYSKRAKEYDKVYLNPPEQGDLLKAASIFQSLVSQKVVLEIACGTGYWTEQMAKTAASVHATDINEQLIDMARARTIQGNVTFDVADMYSLASHQKHDVVFGGFIWSHILLQDLDLLLEKWKGCLKADGILIFIDSNYVVGTHHDEKKITTTDGFGNTYQTRQLEDGSMHLVLKNFPTKDFLFQKISRVSTEINYKQLEYYWIASCKI